MLIREYNGEKIVKRRSSSRNYAELIPYKNELIELYSISDESFSLGYLRKIGERFSIFEALNEVGGLDSLQLRANGQINQIKNQTKYTDLFEKFSAFNKKRELYDPYLLLDQSLDSLEPDDLTDLLKVDQRIYTFILENDDYIHKGPVQSFNKNQEEIKVKLLDFEAFQVSEEISFYLKDLVAIDLISNENYLLRQGLNGKL